MRQNILFILAAVSATILVWNGITILNLPEQVTNVGAYKIIYFHVSAAFTAFTGFFTALVASLLYLKTGQLKYDAFAAGVTEVALAFATGNLVSGMIWGRFAWGIWWTWDARLTSMLVCLLMYYGYVMLRQAVTEPTQRGAPVRRRFNLRLHQRRVRLSIDCLVSHAASGAGLEPAQRRRDVATVGIAHLLELARAGLPGRGPGERADAPGRVRNTNRFPAPHGAQPLKGLWTLASFNIRFSAC